MAGTFENGQTHEMVLEPDSERPCNFIGQLKNMTSSLAVTGCLNTPEDKMHITFLSHLNTKPAMYEMDYVGHVTAEKIHSSTKQVQYDSYQLISSNMYV